MRTSEKKKKMATPLPDGLLRTVHFEEVGGWGECGGGLRSLWLVRSSDLVYDETIEAV